MSGSDIRSVSHLMKLINEIAKRNQQTVDRIKSKYDENVVSYKYVVTYNYDKTAQIPKFYVQQQPQNTKMRSICDAWRNTENQLITIPDIFNDKIDFNCSTFDHIVRLNNDMLPVVLKYELFGETEKAFEEVKKFYENYKQLEIFLAKLLQQVDSPEQSQLPQLNERFDNINNELNDIRVKFNEKIQFSSSGQQGCCPRCRR